MNSLPELAGGPIRYRLPLAEETALRLADVLLAESADVRAERLEAALVCDKSFAVWAILVAPEPADPTAPLPALVAWMMPRIARLLAGSSVARSPAAANGAGWNGGRQSGFDPLLTGSRRSVEPIAGAPLATGTDRNRQFVGLVAGAVEWLMQFGTPPPDRQQAVQSLPAWLAQTLAQNHQHDAGPNISGQTIDAQASYDWAGLLAQLATRTVRLAELEGNFERTVEQEKLAALKGFAYGAGHEINNPLANISARAQTLLKDEPDPERRQKLAAINTQAFRAHEMIADLMLFASPPEWKPARVAIAPLLAELESAWRRQATDQQTKLNMRIADDSLAAWADRSALAVALRSLVANSLEALGRGGAIEIAVTPARLAKESADADGAANDKRASIRPAPDAVAICVRDDGPGIDPAVRARIFDPFFSGREAGRGLGFGLPKCWRIATALGGRIDVVSGPAAGAAFTLVVPLAPQ